jgi:hypothetical protein
MDDLILALLTWIVVETRLLMPGPPAVVLASETQISQLVQADDLQASANVRALYDHDGATVYLRHDWDRADLRSRATLLHELVHHVQYFNSIPTQCPGSRERQAYQLTVKWLRDQGVADPYALLNIDEFTISVLSICVDSSE